MGIKPKTLATCTKAYLRTALALTPPETATPLNPPPMIPFHTRRPPNPPLKAQLPLHSLQIYFPRTVQSWPPGYIHLTRRFLLGNHFRPLVPQHGSQWRLLWRPLLRGSCELREGEGGGEGSVVFGDLGLCGCGLGFGAFAGYKEGAGGEGHC